MKAAGKLLTTAEGFIKSSTHPTATSRLRELDIVATIRTIEALLEDLKGKIISDCGKSIKVCLTNIENTIKSLQESLDSIQEKVKTHNASYWYYFGYANVTQEMSSIESNSKILNNRVDLLAKAVTIELQALAIMSSSNSKLVSSKETNE